jgi:FGGY-family pentulose kinase
MDQHNIERDSIRGIGFDATCSLAVFSNDTDEPIAVTGPNFDNKDGHDRNVILWLDHRPVEETNKINATKHNLLRYVGGKMSIEMEIPKVLWLKNNMPKELFDRCKFYDLTDALTHMATGSETRSFCSVVCKQGFVPVGVDGSVKGWQEDFLTEIGLEDLVKDDFKRMGGVDKVVCPALRSSLHMADRLLERTLPHCWGTSWHAEREGRCRHGSATGYRRWQWCN